MRRGFDGSQRLHTAEPRAKRGSGLARVLQYSSIMLAMSVPLLAATSVAAEDRILLSEVLPALLDTPLGGVDLAAAPLPGGSVTVNRSDVLRALARAGLTESIKASDIPKSTRISRTVVALLQRELASQAQNAVTEAVAPCQLHEARYPNDVRVNAGPREYRGEFSALRNGTVTGAVFVTSGGRVTRVPVVASLSCPPPDVSAGTQLTAIAVVGHVTASAPAEAKQPGRIGEVIRITNRATGASLRGRVVDGHTVEVVP